jgi:hypothetical protein
MGARIFSEMTRTVSAFFSVAGYLPLGVAALDQPNGHTLSLGNDMPFLTATGHRLTPTHWKYRDQIVPLGDQSQVFHQLRKLQSNWTAALTELRFDPSGGIVNAQFRCALSVLGNPRYVEYCCFNQDNTPALILNAIIGFRVGGDGLKGTTLIRFAGKEIRGTCSFGRGEAVLDLQTMGLACQWSEGGSRSDLATARVIASEEPQAKELFSLRGQSKEAELGGKFASTSCFSDENSSARSTRTVCGEGGRRHTSTGGFSTRSPFLNTPPTSRDC